MADNDNSSPLTVLITGASRGLGRGLVAAYLSRPTTTVIACVRSPTAAPALALPSLPHHPTSRLILLPLEATSPSSITTALATLPTHGISHLDIVIANAGGSAGDPARLAAVDVETTVQANITLNAYGPLWLLQGCLPLMRKGAVFGVMSSLMGSGALVEEWTGRVPLGPYGLSKLLVNGIVRRVAVEEQDVVVLALDPGVVETEGALGSAKEAGVEMLGGISVEESVAGLVKVIAEATKEKSGHFIKYTGEETPW